MKDRGGELPRLATSLLSGERAVQEHSNFDKPTTHKGDLAKLPRALKPLIERPKWVIWRWTQQSNGRWQKPPYQALDPRRHASTKDPRSHVIMPISLRY